MNLYLLNALTVDLIKNDNFIPIRDEYDNYNIPDDIRILERRDVSDYYIVELIDGDQLSNGDIISHFNENINNWVESEVTNLLHVYFFTRPITDEVERLIENNHLTCEKTGISYSNILLDMNSRKFTTSTNEPDSVFFLEMHLSRRLKEPLDGSEKLPQIVDLINQEEPYPTIQEATDKVQATYVILGINIVFFLAGYLIKFLTGENLINGNNLLHEYGAKNVSLILSGEYWRFFTPIFLHLNFQHILLNSVSLLIFGQAIEKLFGARKFILIYLSAGICGNIASFAFSSSNSLGASGAIMGLGGSLIYIWKENKAALSTTGRKYLSLVFMAVISILSGFKLQGVDNFAHLGGIIGGFFISGVLWKTNSDKTLQKIIYSVLLIILSVIGIYSRF